MEKEILTHKNFYKFLFKEFKSYTFFSIITTVFFSLLNILTDLIIPTFLIKYLVLVLCFRFNFIGIFYKLIILVALLIIANLIKYFIENVNKKYLNNIDKQTNRNILKYLISNGYNLENKDNVSEILSSSVIRIFYRLLYQSIPLIIMYVITLIYLAKIGKTLLIFNILFFLVITYIREKKKIFQKIMMRKQFIGTNNLIDKLIFKYNETDKEIPAEDDNVELFDENDFTKISNDNNSKQLTLYEKLSGKLYSILARKINITFYTISIIIYIYYNHEYLFSLNVNLFLYIFLVYKVFSIIKIIINNDIVNFKDINKINKTLDNLEKNKTVVV